MERIFMRILSAKLPLSRLNLGLSLLFAAANVSAGNMGPVETELWAGAYLGVHAGSGAGDVDQTINDVGNNDQVRFPPLQTSSVRQTSSGNLHGDVTGSLANLFIGYNFHRPGSSFVYGGQLEGTLFSDVALKGIGIRYLTSTTRAFNGTITTLSNATDYEQLDELHSTFSFIARGGYLVRENTLLYVLGGVTEGHFVVPPQDDPQGGKRYQWETGGTVGGGAEYKFNEHLSFLAEYRYMWFNYDRNRSNFTNQTIIANNITTTTQSSTYAHIGNDLNFNLGQIGIVYRI
jgi:opacity protein-like surface antigen